MLAHAEDLGTNIEFFDEEDNHAILGTSGLEEKQKSMAVAGEVKVRQANVASSPYSIPARFALAKAYQASEYPDLAVGEAYLALLLVDECLGASGEFEDEAVEAAVADYGEENHEKLLEVVRKERSGIYLLLAENLISLNNLKQAHDYLHRAESTDPLNPKQRQVIESLQSRLRDSLPQNIRAAEHGDYPTWGLARRQIYPWNSHEPDRSTQESLIELNVQLAITAPKLEARIVELPNLTSEAGDGGLVKQIGLFAKEDLQPGECILHEKSVLTATSRIHDSFCDACAARLPPQDLGAAAATLDEDRPISCPDCAETVFCSQFCLDTATELYHPTLCDAPLGALAKDVEPKEASHALYALLLLRAFALASHQELHPLSLPQTRFLWGDFISSTPSLPFSIEYNVILPLTMLEKLDINVFEASAEGRFSTWVFNTLYAKFRGTADAKQGPDGRPEVGAVHPLWCLANHSCAPNVRWEWEGGMRFWVRTDEQTVHWRPGENGGGNGIKKDEQILGHYCDVELAVGERREWAMGALGGECLCERCVWEAAHPEQVRSVRIAR